MNKGQTSLRGLQSIVEIVYISLSTFLYDSGVVPDAHLPFPPESPIQEELELWLKYVLSVLSASGSTPISAPDDSNPWLI